MKIKKFNDISSTDKVFEGNYNNFIDDVIKLTEYDDEYEQGYEPSNSDIMSELGELVNSFELNNDDLKKIIDDPRLQGHATASHWIKVIYDDIVEWDKKISNDNSKIKDALKKSGLTTDVDKFISNLKKNGYFIQKNGW